MLSPPSDIFVNLFQVFTRRIVYKRKHGLKLGGLLAVNFQSIKLFVIMFCRRAYAQDKIVPRLNLHIVDNPFLTVSIQL